jgi:hypothetical protein
MAHPACQHRPIVAALLVAACARDPLPQVCPEVAAGDLVLTEIRGAQTGTDAPGQWVELANASARAVDLAGLGLRMRRLDGSADLTVFVRAARPLAAGSYAVLGRFAAGVPPANVTYADLDDLSASLYSSGALELEACGDLVDRVVYRGLPAQGSLAFDGARDPSGDGNDAEAAWCADAAGDGHPGSPGARNPACAR